MNAHPTYDITWHYDLQRKKVVVTNVHLTIPSGLAPKTGGGFWDTYVIKRAIDPAPVKEPFLLMLDSIEDPHNLGSILRSADATIKLRTRSIMLTRISSQKAQM